MRKKIYLFILLSMLLVSSCATNKVRHKEYKKGPTPYSMDSINIYNDGTYTVYIKKFTYTDKDFFAFNIHYAGYGWLNLTGKVDILADENIITICDTNPKKKIHYSTFVSEDILAPITDEDLLKITNCSTIMIQVDKESISINNNGISKIKNFYLNFVNNHKQ